MPCPALSGHASAVFLTVICVVCRAVAKGCWIRSYGNGGGSPLHDCPDGKVKDGALCYDPCPSDGTTWRMVAGTCYQDCPPDFNDAGLFCSRPVHSIYPFSCPWTDGLCTCGSGCPSVPGASTFDTRLGCLCTYGDRSIGKGMVIRAPSALQCSSSEVQQGLLCYPQCEPGTHAIGPMCWSNGQGPASYPAKCGDILLGVDKAACDELNGDMAKLEVTDLLLASATAGATICAAGAIATGGLAAAACVPFAAVGVAAAAKRSVDETKAFLDKTTGCPAA
jgi:hypothetical protein